MYTSKTNQHRTASWFNLQKKTNNIEKGKALQVVHCVKETVPFLGGTLWSAQHFSDMNCATQQNTLFICTTLNWLYCVYLCKNALFVRSC